MALTRVGQSADHGMIDRGGGRVTPSTASMGGMSTGAGWRRSGLYRAEIPHHSHVIE
jgi:hypothetical protein